MTTVQSERIKLQVTWRAQDVLENMGCNAEELAERHASGDWGTISEQQRISNCQSQISGGPILSSYRLSNMAVIWIITSADRNTTAVLTPSDSAVYRTLL